MITINKDTVTLPRKTWDRLKDDQYFDELMQNLLDTEILADAMDNDNDFMDLREYDRQRNSKNVQSTAK